MPSHLTRTVFRRLLANEPIIHRGCLRKQGYSTAIQTQDGRKAPIQRTRSFPVVRRYQQRRTLFGLGLFKKPPQEARDAQYPPGVEKMMEYAKRERMKARLPPVEEMSDAFNRFFAKTKSDAVITDTQAQLLLQNLKYCIRIQSDPGRPENSGPVLAPRDLQKAAGLLQRRVPPEPSVAHQDLARVLCENLRHGEVTPLQWIRGLNAYIFVLSRAGQTEKARDLVFHMEEVDSTHRQSESGQHEALNAPDKEYFAIVRRWGWVLSGFAKEMNEEGLQSTLKTIEAREVQPNADTVAAILRFYFQRPDAGPIRHWWEYTQRMANDERFGHEDGDHDSYASIVSMLLQWCMRTENMELGHSIVREVMQTNPSKPIWDAVLVWAAGTKKSVDEIGRMLDVMEKSNQSIPDHSQWRVPDSATLNALVEFAISRGDPYMAERFISMSRDRGIEPDARTFVLQMDYRLSVDDVDGALVAYKHLQSHDLSSNEDVPAVNRLVVALCKAQRHDFDTVMNVAADLSDRRVRFEPETVSALSLLHLGRDEIHDVIDLLNTHAHAYSSTERAHVSSALITFCTAPTTTISRAWDTYTILREIFDELDRDQRTTLMTSFFTRARPDMAVHIFNHMRSHSRADTLPTIATYVTAFAGCARARDLESLEVIHNQLKLDYNVDQNTHVRNALIAAYSACDAPRDALDYWDEIVASREGPSVNSVHIALRACEKAPFGDLKAKEIWARLRRNNVDCDQRMWCSYVAALAGNGDIEGAVGTLEEGFEGGECGVDVMMLAGVFNAAPGQSKQREVEGFARERFGGVWEQVVGVGWEEMENGMRVVRVDRSVTP